MGTKLTGTGRVLVYPLLHRWPDGWTVLASTRTGRFGEAAVIATIPQPADAEDIPSLLDMAARHEPERIYGTQGDRGHADASWLISTGSNPAISGPVLEFRPAAWTLQREHTIELRHTMSGKDLLHIGRLQLNDADLMHQAQNLLRTHPPKYRSRQRT